MTWMSVGVLFILTVTVLSGGYLIWYAAVETRKLKAAERLAVNLLRDMYPQAWDNQAWKRG